ncbi:MAG: hypothetical protein HOW97_00475 [Catenulispora sp.]|nr:hypothetical protein [Catenulispora sp.]
MPDYGQPLMFGTFLTADTRNAGAVVEPAEAAGVVRALEKPEAGRRFDGEY